MNVRWLGVVVVAALGCTRGAQPTAQEAGPAAAASAAASAPAAESGAPVASAAPSAATSASAATQDAGPPPPPPIVVPDDMALVPAGTFTMGADDEGEMDERPAHQVTLGAFLLDLNKVTNAQYNECVEAKVCPPYNPLNGSRLMNGQERVFHRPTHPVVGVSWFNAKAYCEWKGKRLPREAEWERAARGDDNRRYPWGTDQPDPKRHGCFGGRGATEPVGKYPDGRGQWGHFSLMGNVWEWQADEYDPFAYQRPAADQGIPGTCEEIQSTQDQLRKQGKQGYTGSNPIPTECERVLRGGAYNYVAAKLRNSNRVHHPGSWRIAVAGFRCAKDVGPAPAQ